MYSVALHCGVYDTEPYLHWCGVSESKILHMSLQMNLKSWNIPKIMSDLLSIWEPLQQTAW